LPDPDLSTMAPPHQALMFNKNLLAMIGDTMRARFSEARRRQKPMVQLGQCELRETALWRIAYNMIQCHIISLPKKEH